MILSTTIHQNMYSNYSNGNLLNNITMRCRFTLLVIKDVVKTIYHLAIGILRSPSFLLKGLKPLIWDRTIEHFTQSYSSIEKAFMHATGIFTPKSTLDYFLLRDNLENSNNSLQSNFGCNKCI